jgi:hypothetical protein
LAGIDRELLALLIDLEPTLANRRTLIESYQYSAGFLREAEEATAGLADAITSPGERWRTEFSYTDLDGARERLRDRESQLASLRGDLARIELVVTQIDERTIVLLVQSNSDCPRSSREGFRDFPGQIQVDSVRCVFAETS